MNVDKGSWKNRSLTWGKGLALRVGPRVLCTNDATARGGCGKRFGLYGLSFGGVGYNPFRDIYLAQ